MKLNKIKLGILLVTGLFTFANCEFPLVNNDKKEEEKKNDNMLLGIVAYVASLPEIEGNWNDYTGNGTALNSTDHISSQTKYWYTDNSSFPSCNKIVSWDNSQKYMILYVPTTSESGSCPNASSLGTIYNPGTYSKIVWLKNSAKNNSYWYCTIAFGKATAAVAEATTDTTVKTDPANSGCGGFSWSRLDKI